MPQMDVDGVRLHYQLSAGPSAAAPVLMLSNSLGTDLNMWNAQLPGFERHFRVLRYDTRGHGASAVGPAPTSIERLGQDALALLDALGLEQVLFCGLSL